MTTDPRTPRYLVTEQPPVPGEHRMSKNYGVLDTVTNRFEHMHTSLSKARSYCARANKAARASR